MRVRGPSDALCVFGAALALTGAAVNAQDPEDIPQTDEVPPILQGGLAVFPADGEGYIAEFAGDGTYRTGSGEAGGWILQNGYLCLSAETGSVRCTAVAPDAGPGDQWTVTSSARGTTRYALPGAPDIPDGEGG